MSLNTDDIRIVPELEQLVSKLALQHGSACKSRKDYAAKYAKHFCDIFKIIYREYTLNPDLEHGVELNLAQFHAATPDFKQILFELYNDDLIYFSVSKNNGFSSGYDKKLDRRSSTRFWLAKPVRESLASGVWPAEWSKRFNGVRAVPEKNDLLRTRLKNALKNMRQEFLETLARNFSADSALAADQVFKVRVLDVKRHEERDRYIDLNSLAASLLVHYGLSEQQALALLSKCMKRKNLEKKASGGEPALQVVHPQLVESTPLSSQFITCSSSAACSSTLLQVLNNELIEPRIEQVIETCVLNSNEFNVQVIENEQFEPRIETSFLNSSIEHNVQVFNNEQFVAKKISPLYFNETKLNEILKLNKSKYTFCKSKLINLIKSINVINKQLINETIIETNNYLLTKQSIESINVINETINQLINQLSIDNTNTKLLRDTYEVVKLDDKAVEKIIDESSDVKHIFNNVFAELSAMLEASNCSDLAFEECTNKSYLKLTYADGTPVLDKLPRFGRFGDGRIYSKFHVLSRDVRKTLRLNNMPIKELWDISHSYPTMLGELAKGRVPEEERRRYIDYIMHNDIYTDCLKLVDLPASMRNDIKPYFNKWILGLPSEIIRSSHSKFNGNKPILMAAVAAFMYKNFNNIYNMVFNWETETRMVPDKHRFSMKKKQVKTISHALQQVEKKIIDNACSVLDCDYVTLHDAIYVSEEDYNALAGEIDFDKLMWFTLGWVVPKYSEFFHHYDEVKVKKMPILLHFESVDFDRVARTA